MLIVSQNKAANINYENIEAIYLQEKNGKIEINVRGEYDYTIGKYETKERAKQVLEEIADCCAFFQLLYSPNVSIQKTIKGKKLKKVIVYEMPEE